MPEPAHPVPERYLRELPPRHLDLLTRAVLLLGDAVSQSGWALVALGSVFFWTTSMQSELRSQLTERNVVWAEKAGLVLEADSTGRAQGGQSIWRYGHQFALEGQRYRGESFSVGKKFDAKQIVFIRYDVADPRRNFIIGLRRQPHREQVNWLLFLPLLGIPLLLWPMRGNLRTIRLLKIGDFTRGHLTQKKATNRSRKKGGTELPVIRYDFQFEHNGTRYTATCRTHLTHLVEDEASEMVLFDRYNPTFNLVYDAVPGMPVIDPQGRMLPVEGWRSWVLFLPVFTVVVNLVFFWLD